MGRSGPRRPLYDTWHGITVLDCFACGEFFDPVYYKEVCPVCAFDNGKVADTNDAN